MSYLVGKSLVDPALKRYNGGGSSFSMDNDGTTFSTLLWVDGVAQTAGTDFTVSGTTISTTSSTPSGTNNVVSLQMFNTGVTTTPANDSVTGAKIADDAIDSEHYVDGSIDTAHLAADAVTGAKIADDALDSEHYTDGSIDTAHLAADVVTGAKIADDALDSEHYTDGSIDAAHIASNAVTTAKINADAVTGAKIADDAIDSEHYTDGSIDLAHMSSESVDEDNLHISNSGSNGQFLSKQSGNSGGLTWADAGGAWAVKTSGTVSSGSEIAITGISKTIKIILDQMSTSTVTFWKLTTSSDGGSSYDTGASDYHEEGWSFNAQSSSGNASTGRAYISLAPNLVDLSQSNSFGRLEIDIPNPQLANFTHINASYTCSQGNTNEVFLYWVAGARESSADVDAVKIVTNDQTFSCSYIVLELN